MKKKKYLFGILFVIISMIIVILCNSDYIKAKNIMKLYSSSNYPKIYEEYDKFFNNSNSQNIIEKYYDKVFDSNTPSDAYELLQARYLVSMLHVGQLEQFEKNICENIKITNVERYLRIFWTNIIEDADIMSIDIIKNVDEIFYKIQKENDDLMILHYFWNKYFNLNIAAQMETEVVTNTKYLEQRGNYVFTLLLMEQLDIFKNFYVEEYAKLPEQYSGMEEMFWIKSNSLNEQQLDCLNDSLSLLLTTYEDLNKKELYLKTGIIVKLQEAINQTNQEQSGDGSVIDTPTDNQSNN